MALTASVWATQREYLPTTLYSEPQEAHHAAALYALEQLGVVQVT